MRSNDGAIGRIKLICGIAFALILVLPGTAFGARFGAKLTSATGVALQPDNSNPPHGCDPPAPFNPCTRVAVNFEHAVNGNKSAPVSGTIDKIRLIAGSAGHFRLQLARAKNITGAGGDAKVVRSGPRIDYLGKGFNADPAKRIEAFNVNLHVNQGDYLTMRMTRTSVLRCNSGGTRQLLFEPPLLVGGGFTHTTNNDGCTLMLQARIKT
jgi:hypothetical protein